MTEKIVDNAAKLVHGTLDNRSLLALVVGREHLTRTWQANGQPIVGPAKNSGFAKSASSIESSAPLASIETINAVLAKLGGLTSERTKRKTRRTPGKRDTVIFAAILRELKGMKYCLFLQKHGIKPKWADAGPATYPTGYQAGNPWRKKAQDEKTRARQRMDSFADSELAETFSFHLREEFDDLSRLLRSRNSRLASKHSSSTKPHKD